MATVNDLLAAARSEVGFTESPPGSNMTKFAAEVGHANGAFWCTTFTVAMLKRAAVPIAKGANTASTRANLAAWKKANRFVAPADIEPGDILFFHLSGRNGNDHNVPDHTAIAAGRPAAGRVATIEGNTSPGNHGSQDNGGGVFERSRPMSVTIGGGRPDFAAAPKPKLSPTQEDDDNMEIIKPVGNAGEPDVGTEFARFGSTLIALRDKDDLQQLANTYASGKIENLPTREIESRVWTLMREGFKIVT